MVPASDVFLFLLLDLVTIIAVGRLFGWVARRFGQPSVIGEILAGILLGPTILGRLVPEAPRWLFPHELFVVDGREVVRSLSQALFPAQVPLEAFANVGLIFFMFLVGLELQASLMRRAGRRAAQISLSGIITPLLLGMSAGLLLLGVNNAGSFAGAQPGVSFPPPPVTFALFLGAAMCVTAFPVLARILVETGLYKLPVGTTALCAAAVDDVVAWILLAAVVGLTRTGSAAAALPVFLLTLAYVACMATVVRQLLDQLAKRYERTGRLTVDQVAIVLAGTLASAFLTERMGIHAIFGAFVFGAIMPKRSGLTHELTDKIEDFTVVVLLPIFFTVTGLRTNLFTLNSAALLGWTVLLIAVATLGKFAGCGIAARMTGSSPRDAVILGALMNTRGLTELVILTIGRDLGVLSDRTFAMMVIMALVTTALAAPIVNRLISRDDLVGALVGPAPAPAGGPAAAVTRILVAIGNPLNAPALVDAALRLLGTRRPAELLLVRLIPTSRAPEFRTGLLEVESQVEAAVESMRPLVEQAAAVGAVARPISFLSDDVGPDLARMAADPGCEAMLLGWHRASLPRNVIQALVRRVFTLAACDVAIFVDRAGQGITPAASSPGPVLVLLAGGAHDGAALRFGAGLAQQIGTSLHIVGYVGAQPGLRPTEASERLARLADALRQESGEWVVPVFAEGDASLTAVAESAEATVAVVPVGEDWPAAESFGQPAADLAGRLACPAIVLRAAGTAAPAARQATRVLAEAQPKRAEPLG